MKKPGIKSISTGIGLMLLQAASVFASPSANGINSCIDCTSCPEASRGFVSLPFSEFPFLLLVEVVAIFLLFRTNQLKKIFWVLGLTLFVGLSVSFAGQIQNGEKQTAIPNDTITETTLSVVDTTTSEAFTDDEFVSVDSDEFQSIENSDEFVTADGDGDFQEFIEEPAPDQLIDDNEITSLVRTIIALLMTVIAGFAYTRFKGRKLRFVILLASLIYLGFYSSACPCMISSFQNLILISLGEPIRWVTLIWFLGLLPITYIFGKVWCGWVCHLGALQEFIYRPGLFKGLHTEKAQRALKIVQYIALIALVVQLLITRTNLFIKIDPFKVAFNLFSVNITGYVLLAILLISSLLIYRPFCRAICPIGLVLGWIEKIPGASRLQITPSCKSCKQCVKVCDSNAISSFDGKYIIDQENCIRCGNCLDTCRFDAIEKNRKLRKEK